MPKPTKLDQPALDSSASLRERERVDQKYMDGDWRKIAEEICQESAPERILALSRELIERLDKKNDPSRVINIRKTD